MSSKNKTSAMKEGATPALVPKLRFPEFQGSEAWRFTTLDAVCEILNNRRRPITGNERTPGPYPYYGASGIVDYVGDFIFDERLLLVGEDGAKWGAFEKTAFIADGKYWVNNHAHVLKPFSANDTLLENYLAMQDLSPFVTGAAPPKLTLGKLKGIPVPLPPKPAEQQKIAACLSSVDELMAAQARKLDALKTHKKGLMQQLFPREGATQPRLRFPEFDAAADWEVQPLESLADRGSGHTPSKNCPEYYGGGIKWVSLADSKRLDGGLIFKTETEISAQGIKKSSAVLHPAGTVLISRDAGVGKSAVMAEPMAVSQHFIVWTCHAHLLSNWFLYYQLQEMKPVFERIATGSTIKTIGLPFFKELTIAVPTVAEQQRIAACLSSLDALITAKTQKLEALKTHKQGLMQQLFPAPEETEA